MKKVYTTKVLLVVILVACGGIFMLQSCNGKDETKKKGTPLATVNGKIITMEEVMDEWSEYSPKARAPFDSIKGQKRFLDNFIVLELLYQEGLRMELEKDEYIQRTLERKRRKLVAEAVYSRNIGPAEIMRYYQENFIRIGQIFIEAKEDWSDAKKKKARKKADKVLAEIKRGMKFEDAAKKYSEDGTAEMGGDVGYISRDAPAMQELIDSAFNLKDAGDLSSVINSPMGYHILIISEKRGDLNPSGLTSSLSRFISEKLKEQNYNAFISQLAAAAKIDIHEDVFARLIQPYRIRMMQSATPLATKEKILTPPPPR